MCVGEDKDTKIFQIAGISEVFQTKITMGGETGVFSAVFGKKNSFVLHWEFFGTN